MNQKQKIVLTSGRMTSLYYFADLVSRSHGLPSSSVGMKGCAWEGEGGSSKQTEPARASYFIFCSIFTASILSTVFFCHVCAIELIVEFMMNRVIITSFYVKKKFSSNKKKNFTFRSCL